ncbi:MAG: hypothetical protein AABZ64_09750, partial [Nitrospinota bacterium]
ARMARGRGAGRGPRGRAAEGYWRSWFEPAWVLRDLYRKAPRRNPWGGRAPFPALHRAWERLWEGIEGRFGHLFCKNVIVCFRKPPGGEGEAPPQCGSGRAA